MDSNTNLQPNQAYPIEVLIKNLGYALQSNTSLLKFLPIINSISQNTGSLVGGTQITLLGQGFNSRTTLIQIGQNYYYNNDPSGTKVNYDSIELKTNAELEGSYEIIVTSNNVKSVCSAANCNFAYSQAVTPTIDSVSPNRVDSSSLISINGSNFGTNLTNVNVKIGTQSCSVSSVTNTEITCQLVGLNLGNQLVRVNIFGVGDAQNSQYLYVTGSPSLSTISPLIGSIYGGTLLTLNGNGFDSTTRVLLHTSECKIVSFTVNSLTCLTGPHSANNLNFTIR